MIYIDIPQPQIAADSHRYQTKTRKMRKDRRKRRTSLLQPLTGAAWSCAEDPAAVSRSDSLWTKRGHSCRKPWQVTSFQTNCYTYLYIYTLLFIIYYLTLCDIVWNSAHHWVHNGYRRLLLPICALQSYFRRCTVSQPPVPRVGLALCQVNTETSFGCLQRPMILQQPLKILIA